MCVCELSKNLRFKFKKRRCKTYINHDKKNRIILNAYIEIIMRMKKNQKRFYLLTINYIKYMFNILARDKFNIYVKLNKLKLNRVYALHIRDLLKL